MSDHTAPTEAAVVERTRAWVHENYLFMQSEPSLRDDDPLLKDGVIDSMGVIELVEFLQDTYGIKVGDDEIIESNLGSITAIGRFVHEKCKSHPDTKGWPRQVA